MFSRQKLGLGRSNARWCTYYCAFLAAFFCRSRCTVFLGARDRRRAGFRSARPEHRACVRLGRNAYGDLHIDRRFETYERLRKRLAATKVQRTWRKILARVCEVPLGLLGLTRPGYLRGVGGIMSRAVHHPPFWVQQQISEIYTAKLR